MCVCIILYIKTRDSNKRKQQYLCRIMDQCTTNTVYDASGRILTIILFPLITCTFCFNKHISHIQWVIHIKFCNKVAKSFKIMCDFFRILFVRPGSVTRNVNGFIPQGWLQGTLVCSSPQGQVGYKEC